MRLSSLCSQRVKQEPNKASAHALAGWECNFFKKEKRTKLKQPKKQTGNTESEISLFFSVAFS